MWQWRYDGHYGDDHYGDDDNMMINDETSQAFKARIAECEQAELNLKSKLTMTLKEIKVLSFFSNLDLNLCVPVFPFKKTL